MDMPEFETLTLPTGAVTRRHAAITSPTLLALPAKERPKPIVGCATCPAGSWYHDEASLKCRCSTRRYVSYVKSQPAIVLCDDREAALLEDRIARAKEWDGADQR